MRKQYTITLILLIIFFNTYGQIFNNHHVITTGSLQSSVNSMAVVDLNNDSYKDIIASCMSYQGNNIYFLENKGNEQFETLQEIPVGTYLKELHMIRTGDLNNDGLEDIVYSRYNHFSQLHWLRNIGDNQFEYGGELLSITNSGWRTVSFIVVDLNGDNYDDIVIGCKDHDDYNLEVRINRGDGTFFPNFSLIEEGDLWEYFCSDIDNDEDIDIIYSVGNPYKIAVKLNNGFGEFMDDIIIDTNVNQGKYDLQIFDIDNNNFVDVLGFSGNSITLFLNNGNNEFSELHIPKDSLFNLSNTKHLDFDNDGDIDLINSKFKVLENLGNNSFQYRDDIDFPLHVYEYQIDDINNNGDEDIVFGLINGGIGYIEDVSSENLKNWRLLTSKVMEPKFPALQKINNDEYYDICVLDHDFKYVFYLNNGDGEFYDTITFNKLHSYYDQSIFFDIDGDGFGDIASYANTDFVHEIDSADFKLAKNNGDNTFSGFYIDDYFMLRDRFAYFNDYNNDSVLDVLLTDYNNYTDSIFLFTINPNFTVNLYDTIILDHPIKISSLKFYDFDNNSENDILINTEDSIFILYSFNGTFTDSLKLLIASSSTIYDFNPMRINEDSLCDLFYLARYSASVNVNYNGTAFEQSFNLESDDSFRNSYIVDLDNDSIDELICCSYTTLRLFKDIKDDNISMEEYPYKRDYNPKYEVPFIFSDIDVDGDIDLLCTSTRYSDISWFENSFIDTLDYSSFPENNAVWTEQNANYESDSPKTWTSLYITETDTMLNNKSYTNIYEYYLDSITFDTLRQLYASIRQDVLNKKVFVIRHYLSENKERLLLDFQVNVGDTLLLDAYYWHLNPSATDSLFIVDSISTTTLYNTEERDIFYLSNHKDQTPVSLTVVEGIGSLQNPFGAITDFVNKKQSGETDFCCPEYLLCLSINNEPVYVLNDESKCNTLEVWSSIETKNQIGVLKIYPNPTKNIINIKFFENPLTDFDVEVYNNYGTKLIHHHYLRNESPLTINLNKYKPGVYLLRIKYGNNYYSFKILKTE